MKVLRKRGTFVFSTKKKNYILQFTTKNPWWVPKHESNHAGICNLWGWLFVYFGWYHDGLEVKV